MKVVTIAVRLLFSGVMLYFIYGETGPVTTFTFFLLMVLSEVQSKLNTSLLDIVKKLSGYKQT